MGASSTSADAWTVRAASSSMWVSRGSPYNRRFAEALAHVPAHMARTVIDLDEKMVAEAMRIFGTKTKAKAVRLAMEDAVKRHLRQEFFDAMDAGELDFSEIVESTGPRNADGTLKHNGDHNGGRAA